MSTGGTNSKEKLPDVNGGNKFKRNRNVLDFCQSMFLEKIISVLIQTMHEQRSLPSLRRTQHSQHSINVGPTNPDTGHPTFHQCRAHRSRHYAGGPKILSMSGPPIQTLGIQHSINVGPTDPDPDTTPEAPTFHQCRAHRSRHYAGGPKILSMSGPPIQTLGIQHSINVGPTDPDPDTTPEAPTFHQCRAHRSRHYSREGSPHVEDQYVFSSREGSPHVDFFVGIAERAVSTSRSFLLSTNSGISQTKTGFRKRIFSQQ